MSNRARRNRRSSEPDSAPPNIGDGSPVLAAYLSAKDVNMVDDLYEMPSLVVVPFAVNREQDSDTRAWREKWAAGMVEVKP